MNSNDNKISWFDSLGVINDKLTDIEINRDQNTAQMKLEFFNGLTWTEKFDLLDITPELVNFLFGNFNDTDIILEKENIICINKKNDKGYFEIEAILKRNRINGSLIVHDEPFSVSAENSLKNFDELISYKRDEFDLIVVDYKDTLKTYSADPSYMGFRWLLNQLPAGGPLGFYYCIGLLGAFEDRIKEDSTKYMDIREFVDF